VKKVIVIISLLFSFSILAQDQILEPSWKSKGRSLISFLSPNLGTYFFGPIPIPVVVEAKLPEIPKQVKKSTDIANYNKLVKEPSEYDKLPKDKKRQFDYKFVQELFQVTRRTEARYEDLSSWLNVLEQGGSREGIYQGLVLDDVYAALENIEEKPSQRLLSFSLKFSQRFLNQTFKQESLAQLNLYSLKRILVEKALDLMEHYEVHNLENLNQWYSVFSSELAKDYGPLLKSPIRQDIRSEYHLQWAKSMPVQHIKSEFIIKLHKVMNGLQLLE